MSNIVLVRCLQVLVVGEVGQYEEKSKQLRHLVSSAFTSHKHGALKVFV